MKSELTIDIPGGSMTFQMERVLEDGSLNMIRKVFRMMRGIPEREIWADDIQMYLEGKRDAAQGAKGKKRYEKLLEIERQILGGSG